MKTYVIIFLIFSNCAVIYFNKDIFPDLLSREVAVNRKLKIIESQFSANIIHFQAYMLPIKPNVYSVDNFLFALQNSIYNSEKFKNVYIYKQTKENNQIDFEIKLAASEHGSLGNYGDDFNYWWIMWPAIYPLTFDYPIQPKSGFVYARLEVNIFKEGMRIHHYSLKKSKPYKVFFYGMLDTEPIVSSIHNSYAELLDDFSKVLKTTDF